MSFRFQYEFLLKHRKRVEDLAQKDFLEAKRILDECLEQIRRMYQSIDQSRARIAELQRSGDVVIGEITSLEAFISGQVLRIDQERQKARELMRVAEEKQEALLQAAKERRIIEKWKEKKASAHRVELRKSELREVDDLVVMRSRRSGNR